MMPMPLPATFQMRLLRLPEDGLGQHGGAGAEVVDAVGHVSVPLSV